MKSYASSFMQKCCDMCLILSVKGWTNHLLTWGRNNRSGVKLRKNLIFLKNSKNSKNFRNGLGKLGNLSRFWMMKRSSPLDSSHEI